VLSNPIDALTLFREEFFPAHTHHHFIGGDRYELRSSVKSLPIRPTLTVSQSNKGAVRVLFPRFDLEFTFHPKTRVSYLRVQCGPTTFRRSENGDWFLVSGIHVSSHVFRVFKGGVLYFVGSDRRVLTPIRYVLTKHHEYSIWGIDLDPAQEAFLRAYKILNPPYDPNETYAARHRRSVMRSVNEHKAYLNLATELGFVPVMIENGGPNMSKMVCV
jgi:hypothetical protein